MAQPELQVPLPAFLALPTNDPALLRKEPRSVSFRGRKGPNIQTDIQAELV